MRRNAAIAACAVAVFGALFTADALRQPGPVDMLGLVTDLAEAAFLAAAVVLAAIAGLEMREMKSEQRMLLSGLEQARRDGEKWRQAARSHVAGLSGAISAQFRAWQLTEAEADVAAFLLKGLSHKEVADLRNCSEATVRQHATVVYRKSQLNSRAQLTAYFLEDLLAVPQSTHEDTREPTIIPFERRT